MKECVRIEAGGVSMIKKDEQQSLFYRFIFSVQMPAFVDRLGSPVFDTKE